MPRPLPSTDTVAAAIRGVPGALDQVVSTSLPAVLGWCKRLLGPRGDPEDAAHDVLVVLIDHIGTLQDPVAFPGWLFQVTRRVLSTHRRRAWVRHWLPGASTETTDTGPSPERRYLRDETARSVQELLDQLPEAQRITLILHDLEDRSDAEVADILGVPKGTVKSRLRLGRARLKTLAEGAGLVPTPSHRSAL
ncbi:MAG: RNA polymerase sigma-70 factor (ECF subfamily) [Myxococcota bacterium]|jgi:RNA polymerase sigma-70 factor (ECF subfamily)